MTAAVGPDVEINGPAQPDSGPRSEPSPEPEITEDELFDVLSNRRRRYAVHLLEREDEPLRLGPLAEQIAAWENGIEPYAVSSAQRKRVYTALQQIHLPRMDEAGIVAFDDRAGLVEATEAMDAMDVYVDLVEGRDIPWSGYYLGLSTIGIGGRLGGAVAPVGAARHRGRTLRPRVRGGVRGRPPLLHATPAARRDGKTAGAPVRLRDGRWGGRLTDHSQEPTSGTATCRRSDDCH